jgi:hypothetical protein
MTKVVMLFLIITANGGRIVGKHALSVDTMDQCAGAASYSLNKNKANKLPGLTV